MDINKYLELYKKLGLRVIPIQSQSKKPLHRKWNEPSKSGYKWAKYILKAKPDCNLGILLGNIVDVECDNEEADNRIAELVQGIPHLKYRSSKYHHRLFKNPYKWLKIVKFDGIEFRAHKHCSVVPPSVHHSGAIYKFEDAKPVIPRLPKELKRLLLSKGGKKLTGLCAICKRPLLINQKELSNNNGIPWMCNKCKKDKPVGSVSNLRGNLLNNPGVGELEYDKIAVNIRKLFGRAAKYKRQKAFILPKSGQYFFLDFYFYHFRLAVEIDGSKRLQSAWDDWRSSLLNKHKITVLRFPASIVLEEPDNVLQTTLQTLQKIPVRESHIIKEHLLDHQP